VGRLAARERYGTLRMLAREAEMYDTTLDTDVVVAGVSVFAAGGPAGLRPKH
jgi:hypothetical protein